MMGIVVHEHVEPIRSTISGILLVFYSSVITKMHGARNVRFTVT